MNICIVSNSGEWGPQHIVYNSIKNNTNYDVTSILRKHDLYGFSDMCESFSLFFFKDGIEPEKEECICSLIKSDYIFIFGLTTIKTFFNILFKSKFWKKYKIRNPEKFIKTKKIIYFASSSVWARDNKFANEKCREWPIDVLFYNLELKEYIKIEARKVVPYAPPIVSRYFPIFTKRQFDGSVILCHSPGDKFNSEKDEKGTRFIIKCFEELSKKYSNVSYKIIHGVTNNECIKIKSQCDIFVDQVVDASVYNADPPYLGGQGKSGIEAMLLGCLTMTSYRDLNSEPYFPTTPIIQADKQNLLETIEKFITNKDERKKNSAKQKKWVEDYLNEEFFAKYIFDHILN